MRRTTLYDVYDGDKLFLQNVTYGEIEKVFDRKIHNLYQYILNGHSLNGRYKIRISQTPPEAVSAHSLPGDLLREWDTTCRRLRNHIIWVSEGGRRLRIGR